MHRTLDSLPLEKTVFYEGLAYLYLGDKVQAHARFRESMGLSPGTLWAQFAEAYDHLAAGDQKALGALATGLESENVSDGERRYRLVHFFATLGDKDRAMMHFDAAVEAGNFNYPYFAHDRLLDPLRGEDRFTTILNEAKKRHENFPYRYMDPDKEQLE